MGGKTSWGKVGTKESEREGGRVGVEEQRVEKKGRERNLGAGFCPLYTFCILCMQITTLWAHSHSCFCQDFAAREIYSCLTFTITIPALQSKEQ